MLGRSGWWECSRAGAEAQLVDEAHVVGLAVPVASAVTVGAVIDGDLGQGIDCTEGSVGCFRSGGGMGGNNQPQQSHANHVLSGNPEGLGILSYPCRTGRISAAASRCC